MPKSRRELHSSEIREMIDDARRGQPSSIGELLQIYRNYLSVVAAARFRQRLNPRVSPSDVVQETLILAHKRFRQFRGNTEQELVAWLRAILVNSLARFVERHMLAERRDMRREVSMENLEADSASLSVRMASLFPAPGKSPSVLFQQNEDANGLTERLAQLPEDYRRVLVLRNLQELPFEKVSEMMGRSVGATRMLWLRALEKLRQLYLAGEGNP